MPTGEETIRGLSITYPSVSRHDSGVYICSADNGFGNGEPVEQKIKLDVHREYSPIRLMYHRIMVQFG